MTLFGPHSPEPELIDPHELAIRELQWFANLFTGKALGSAKQAVSLTYAACAKVIEDRIEELRQQRH